MPEPPSTQPVTAEMVLSLRRIVFGETRREFARRINCSVKSVYSWEHGTHTPSGPAQRLLGDLYDRHKELLHRRRKGRRKLGTLVDDAVAKRIGLTDQCCPKCGARLTEAECVAGSCEECQGRSHGSA